MDKIGEAGREGENEGSGAAGLRHLPAELVARLWPSQRVVMGWRTSRWLRGEVMPKVSSAWLHGPPGEGGEGSTRGRDRSTEEKREWEEAFCPEAVAQSLQMVTSSASVKWNGPGGRVVLRGILQAYREFTGSITGLELTGQWMTGALDWIEPDPEPDDEEHENVAEEFPADTQLRDAGMQLTVTLLGHSTSLTHLTLYAEQSQFDHWLEQGGLPIFTYALKQCTALQRLALSGGWVGETQLEFAESFHFAETLAATPATHLDLSHCQINSASLEILNDALTSHSMWGVETLNLQHNSLGWGRGLDQLIELLRKTPRLRTLDLGSNHLGQAAGELLQHLSSCEQLTSINLQQNRIWPQHFEAIAAGVRALPRLKSLDLSDTRSKLGGGAAALHSAGVLIEACNMRGVKVVL